MKINPPIVATVMSETHPITEPMRQTTLQIIRQKGISRVDISKATGMKPPWVTKFLNGHLKTINLEAMHQIEELLGIKFFEVSSTAGDRSPLANKIAALVDSDPDYARLAVALEESLANARATYTPRFISTKDMSRIGKEIIRLCHADYDKPGKVAREVLKLLA